MIINPYVFGVAQSYLLDTYSGAAAAYSLRKLSSTYTGNAIRVRRSSDNTEQNIGFDSNGNLDETALTTFVGANNGFVTTWYDQSGNSKDATQTTAANQPQIVTSGVVNLKNGKPCVSFNGTSFRMQTSAISWGTSFTFTGVFDPIRPSSGYSKLYQIGNDTSTGSYAFTTFAGITQLDWSLDDSLVFGNGYNTSSYPRIISNGKILNNNIQYTTFISLNSSSSNFYKNNTEISYRIQQPANSVSASMILYLGSSEGLNGYQYFQGNIQEVIFYASNQSSNRTGINSNINTFYSIY